MIWLGLIFINIMGHYLVSTSRVGGLLSINDTWCRYRGKISDANRAINQGCYNIDANCENLPEPFNTNAYGTIDVKIAGNYGYQIYVRSFDPQKILIRPFSDYPNITFKSWYAVQLVDIV